MASKHFLLVYDLEEQRIVSQVDFDDVQEATRTYAEYEREHLGKSDIEIGLIGADSIDTIHHTHRSYFDGLMGRRSKYLVGLG